MSKFDDDMARGCLESGEPLDALYGTGWWTKKDESEPEPDPVDLYIASLESRVAELDKSNTELNTTITNLEQTIDDLRLQISELGDEVRNLKMENMRLQDAWFADETICPDGSLRPSISTLLDRLDRATVKLDLANGHNRSLQNRNVELEGFIDQLIWTGNAVVNENPTRLNNEDDWMELVKKYKRRAK